MKKVLAAILLAIGGMMAGTGALAQVQMDVYFTANAMERETAERLMELTRRAFPQAQWNCRQAEDEESDQMCIRDRYSACSIASSAPLFSGSAGQISIAGWSASANSSKI